MNKAVQKVVNQITPFLLFGIAIAMGITIIVFLYAVLLWGVVIGLILYGVMYIKEKFFPSEKVGKGEGRVIEHEDD